MRDGLVGFFEMFRFAMDSQGPAFRKTTGEKITNPQDLIDMGFKTIVLHETSFAYNARRLETALQTHFWDERTTGCGVRGGQEATTRVIDTSRCDAAAAAAAAAAANSPVGTARPRQNQPLTC
jgi:hypothetical protein